jgi:hypothetical protein
LNLNLGEKCGIERQITKRGSWGTKNLRGTNGEEKNEIESIWSL